MRDLTSVPSPLADDANVALADWAEMSAILKEDGTVSREDLARALSRTHSVSEATGKDQADDTFNELQDRVDACAPIQNSALSAYPFELQNNGALLALRRSTQSNYGLVYSFLLTITRADMGSKARKLEGVDPTKVFERLCAEVLSAFWGGTSAYSGSLIFGTARKKQSDNHRFQSNIEHLCEQIGEGAGFRTDALAPGAGDGNLDVVAWRRFPDLRPGNLVGFAQCKTGIHWRQGLRELNPANFCRLFMKKPLILEPVRIYMVPSRIDRSQWEANAGDGGILFDRCRVLQFSSQVQREVTDDIRTWLTRALEIQKGGRVTA